MLRETESETPKRLTEEIVSLCDSRGISNLAYVMHRPQKNCDPGMCITNVKNFVEQYGGNVLTGWSVTTRKNLYIECEAHAVWENKRGKMIDITPTAEKQEYTLFSRKDGLPVIKTPSIFIPFTNSELVGEYIKLKNEFERIRCLPGDVAQFPRQLILKILSIDDIFETKVRANENCPCGSGLKFKRCCKR